MKKDIVLTDELLMPVILKHGITREEAEKRLQLLYKSSILETFHPDDPEGKHMIDDFLARDSEESAELVLFEITLNKCMENKEFVNAYDKLRGRSFKQAMYDAKQGNPPKNIEKQLKQFSDHVREYVFSRLIKSV